MRVEEIMSSPVVITQRNVRVKHLKETFDRKHLGALPVLEADGTIVGIVSLRDILLANDELLVQDVMSDRIHILLPNNRVQDAAKIMVDNAIHHLVVMENGVVVGMLSSMDIVRQVALG
jgi:CBS domain-containing protein